jgi:monothiol glutaredoxin
MSVVTEDQILDQIKQIVGEHKVALFMKGTPEAPRCGFSARVVERLEQSGAEYAALDVLVDPRIRQVLSGWSNWPTIPQLFVDGQLVGGCDIVEELAEAGELPGILQGAPEPSA